MARHNIYIREENEAAWQSSTKSDFINDHLAKYWPEIKPDLLLKVKAEKKDIEPTYEPIDT